MTIEKRFPKAPTDVIYGALTLMQNWSILLKETDREKTAHVKEGHVLDEEFQAQLCGAYYL